MLTTGTAGAEGVDLQVFVPEIDVGGVLRLGVGEDGCERRVPALVGVEWRDSDKAVHSGFSFEIAVRVWPRHPDCRPLDSSFVPRLDVHDLTLKIVALHPSDVESHEHFSPVGGFGPAGAGVNLEDGVLVVILIV